MGGVDDQRRYAQEKFQDTLYRSTESCSFNGTSEFNVTFNSFGQDTFPIARNAPRSWSGWVKYEGPADPGNGATSPQIIFNRWFPTPSSAINEGGHRTMLGSGALSGNPAVTRAMHCNYCTNLFNGVWVYTTTSFPLDEWVHVAIVWPGTAPYDASKLEIYWDSVLQSTYTAVDNWTSNAISSNAQSHLIWGGQFTSWDPAGGNPDNPPVLTRFFEGIMDEWCMWNYALTATQVAALYNSSAAAEIGGGHARNGGHVSNGDPALPANRWHRFGEGRDGDPFVFGFTISYGYNPVNGLFGNCFVQAGAGRMPIQDTVDFP